MGNPTPQMVTNEITGKQVNLEDDRIEPPQKMTLDDLRNYAEDRAQEAEQRMERGMEQERDYERGGMEM